MKTFFFLAFGCLCFLNAPAQFVMKIKDGTAATETTLSDGQTVVIIKKPDAIELKTGNDGKTYTISFGAQIPDTDFKGDGSYHAINFKPVTFDEQTGETAAIQIKEKGNANPPLLTFKLAITPTGEAATKSPADTTRHAVGRTLQQYVDFLGFNLNNLEFKQYGIIVISGNTPYVGKQYIHIFLDQYGNSIYGTIPQGISDRQYVVHVFYQTGINSDLQVFDVKKTKGSFNPALNFLNSDIRADNTAAKSKKLNEPPLAWVHKEFLLATSTNDLGFDLTRTSIPDATKPYDYKNEKVASYTINMTPVYHGSFNFGFVSSRLKNPTYTLLPNPANTAENVVKAKEGDNRGIVTVMATIYTSPVVLLQKAFRGKEVPWNKTYGRNFLDDHRFFERIYPAIGVGFTDKTFENIFYGFNWEVVRGAGLFAGWHWGKINTFRTDGNFQFEKTPVTQEDFNLRADRKWDTKFSIGVNVDPMIVARLFGAAVQ